MQSKEQSKLKGFIPLQYNKMKKNNPPLQFKKDKQNKEKITIKDLDEEERLKIGKLMKKLEEEKQEKNNIKEKLNRSTAMFKKDIDRLSREKTMLERKSVDLEMKYRKSFSLIKKLSESKNFTLNQTNEGIEEDEQAFEIKHHSTAVNSYVINNIGKTISKNLSDVYKDKEEKEQNLMKTRKIYQKKRRLLQPKIEKSIDKETELKIENNNEEESCGIEKQLLSEINKLKADLQQLRTKVEIENKTKSYHKNVDQFKSFKNKQYDIEKIKGYTQLIKKEPREELYQPINNKKQSKQRIVEKIKRMSKGREDSDSSFEDFKIARRVLNSKKKKEELNNTIRDQLDKQENDKEFNKRVIISNYKVKKQSNFITPLNLKQDIKEEEDDIISIFSQNNKISTFKNNNKAYNNRMFELIDEIEQSQMLENSQKQFK